MNSSNTEYHDLFKINISKVLFERHVTKIAKGLHCLMIRNQIDIEYLRRKAIFAEMTYELSNLVPREIPSKEKMGEFIKTILSDLRTVMTLVGRVEFEIANTWLEHSAPFESASVDADMTNALKNVNCEEYGAYYKKLRAKESLRCNKVSMVSSGLTNEGCNMYNNLLAASDCDVDEIEKYINDSKRYLTPGDEFWDGYVITAVADLLAFVGKQADKVYYLAHLEAKFDPATNLRRVLPSPASINFYAQLADARMLSNDPQPIDKTVGELRVNLDAIDEILNSSQLKVGLKGNIPIWYRVDAIYRRNHLQSLGFILSFFGEKALSGAELGMQYKKLWEKSYQETHDILSVYYGGDRGKLTQDEQVLWAAAKATTESMIIKDSAAWAALAAVMIAKDADKNSAMDCVSAKFLISIALSDELSKKIKKDAERTARDEYQVSELTREINSRIELSCGADSVTEAR